MKNRITQKIFLVAAILAIIAIPLSAYAETYDENGINVNQPEGWQYKTILKEGAYRGLVGIDPTGNSFFSVMAFDNVDPSGDQYEFLEAFQGGFLKGQNSTNINTTRTTSTVFGEERKALKATYTFKGQNYEGRFDFVDFNGKSVILMRQYPEGKSGQFNPEIVKILNTLKVK